MEKGKSSDTLCLEIVAVVKQLTKSKQVILCDWLGECILFYLAGPELEVGAKTGNLTVTQSSPFWAVCCTGCGLVSRTGC